jgi:tripartite-type tricarboxylate transporter receptor subunit TctC
MAKARQTVVTSGLGSGERRVISVAGTKLQKRKHTRDETIMSAMGVGVVAAVFAGLLATASAAEAQNWPPSTVKIVVPFAAGSTPDLVGRILADNLQSKHPGSSFVVENKPGASGNTGTDVVAKAAPDGSVIGISLGGPLAINTILFSQLPYDPQKDIAPITLLTALPSVLVVPSSLNIGSVADFVGLLKKDATRISYGSIGAGSLSQLCMEAIGLKAGGGKMVHVPYPGSPAAVTALIRGDVQVACLPAISVTPQLGSGSLKILAVTTPQRSSFLPDYPTLKESGIDVESDAWNGLIAPAGTPPAVLATIQREVAEAINSAELKAKFAAQIMEPVGNTPAQFKAQIDGDLARWTPVIKEAGIRVN